MSDGFKPIDALLGTSDTDEQFQKLSDLIKPILTITITNHPSHGTQLAISSSSPMEITSKIVFSILEEAKNTIILKEREQYAQAYAKAALEQLKSMSKVQEKSE